MFACPGCGNEHALDTGDLFQGGRWHEVRSANVVPAVGGGGGAPPDIVRCDCVRGPLLAKGSGWWCSACRVTVDGHGPRSTVTARGPGLSERVR